MNLFLEKGRDSSIFDSEEDVGAPTATHRATFLETDGNEEVVEDEDFVEGVAADIEFGINEGVVVCPYYYKEVTPPREIMRTKNYHCMMEMLSYKFQGRIPC